MPPKLPDELGKSSESDIVDALQSIDQEITALVQARAAWLAQLPQSSDVTKAEHLSDVLASAASYRRSQLDTHSPIAPTRPTQEGAEAPIPTTLLCMPMALRWWHSR